MTISLLASVSLSVLVVTSRPIPFSDAGFSDFAPTSSTLQTSVQAAFRVHPGKDDLTSDATRFHSQQQIEYLGMEDPAVITSFGGAPETQPLFDAHWDENADARNTLASNDESNEARLVSPEPLVNEQQGALTDESPSASLVVLTFSCVAAFLALACVALFLYITTSFHFQMLASKAAWVLLPRFWGCHRSQDNASTTAEERLLNAEEGSAQRHEPHMREKPINSDTVPDMDSEGDDTDEKYQDALDVILPRIYDLPPEDDVPHFDDPPPHSLSHPPNQPAVDRSMPPMRELCSSSVARPAWSVRAIDSPALGLSLRQGGIDATLQPLITHPRRRAYRSPVPEFDIALAMQLRPGLGIGADSAWMVRFLMAMFGWFAVALTGNAR